MCFVILKIKQRQHELTLALVPYPGYFGSEPWPRSFTLHSLVARQRGLLCDSVKMVIGSGKIDNASLSDVNYLEKWQW